MKQYFVTTVAGTVAEAVVESTAIVVIVEDVTDFQVVAAMVVVSVAEIDATVAGAAIVAAAEFVTEGMCAVVVV